MVLANSPAARWRGIASWAELYGVLAQGNGLSEVVDVQVAPAAAMHDGMAPVVSVSFTISTSERFTL